MMQETTFDPVVVEALAAALQADAVAARWVSTALIVIAIVLIVASVRKMWDDDGFLFFAGICSCLLALVVFATFFDELHVPKYTAMKILHNKDLEGRKLP